MSSEPGCEHELRSDPGGWRRYIRDDNGNWRSLNCGSPLELRVGVFEKCHVCRGRGHIPRFSDQDCDRCGGEGGHIEHSWIRVRYEASGLGGRLPYVREYLYLDSESRVLLDDDKTILRWPMELWS